MQERGKGTWRRSSFAFRILAVAALCLLATGRPSADAQSQPHDGRWWNSLQYPAPIGDAPKVMYLAGYLDGIQTGGDLAVSQGLKARAGAPPGCTASRITDFSNIRVGQLEDGLDAFYKDFRNTQIPVKEALLYVRDQISGCNDAVLKQEIEVLRQTWTSTN